MSTDSLIHSNYIVTLTRFYLHAIHYPPPPPFFPSQAEHEQQQKSLSEYDRRPTSMEQAFQETVQPMPMTDKPDFDSLGGKRGSQLTPSLRHVIIRSALCHINLPSSSYICTLSNIHSTITNTSLSIRQPGLKKGLPLNADEGAREKIPVLIYPELSSVGGQLEGYSTHPTAGLGDTFGPGVNPQVLHAMTL